MKKKKEQTIFRLNTVILNKLKLQSIKDVALPTRASDNLRDDEIRLGDVYVCDDAHDEILGIIFKGRIRY